MIELAGLSGRAVAAGMPWGEKRDSRAKSFLPFGASPIYFLHLRKVRLSILVLREMVMLSSVAAELDFIEELRLRRWAREHYVARDRRELSWHPIVLDEMARKDAEMTEVEAVYTCA